MFNTLDTFMIDFELDHGSKRDQHSNAGRVLYKTECLAFANRVPSVCPTLQRVSFLVPESMTARFSGVASQRYYCSSHAGGEMFFDGIDMNAAWDHALDISGESVLLPIAGHHN
jgi:hypothetical protein